MPVDPDQLQDGALCTLNQVLERVPGYKAGDDDDTDAILSDLIVQESEDFLDVTRREIIPANADTVRTFDVDRFVAEERELLIGDAAAVTGVVFKQEDGTVIATLDASSYVKLPRVRKSWQPITALWFPAGAAIPAPLSTGHAFGYGCESERPSSSYRWLAEVTGTWGFPEIPTRVVAAVATFTITRYLNDTAAAGTALAEAANREEFNLAGALAAAFDIRQRLRIPKAG